MAGAASHEADEVPVFFCRVGVALDVSDQLRVNLASGIEAEGGLDHLVLEVAVDGLRAADNLYAALLLQVVLCQHAGVGVRVVTADDYNSLDAQFLAHLNAVVELPSLFEFGTTRTDDIESAGVTVLVDDLFGQFLILALDQTGRTAQETVELVGWVKFLQSVKQTADHVVTAGSLSTGQDNAYVHYGQCCGSLAAGFHSDDRQAVGVREEFLYLFLISNTLRCSAF